MKVAAVSLGCLSSLGAGEVSQRSDVTPIEKVVSLLNGLVTEITAEGTAEAGTYDSFACFCKTKTTSLSTSVTTGQGNINTHSADIAEKTALKTQDEETLVAEKKKLGQLSADLEATEANCAKDKAAYDAANADLEKAIGSLVGAISSLENSKPTSGGASAAGLVSVRTNLQKSLAIADAMKLIDDGPKWQKVSAFIQGREKVNPDDPEYKHHSQGIIDILNDLHGQFTESKRVADEDEGQRVATCTSMITNFNAEIGLTNTAILTLEGNIATFATDIATARKNLVEAEALLKDDQLYLKDLTERCETRANEWDQRTSQRNDELTALNKALAILSGTVSEKDAVNVRAFLQQHKKAASPAKPVPTFVQERSVSIHNAQDLSQDQARAARTSRALALLRVQGGRIGSAALSALAARAAADPFLKVKGLLQKLIERLVHEATEESGKKGFCDTNLAKAELDRQFRHDEVMKLDAEVYSLEVKRDALAQEIQELVDALATLNTDLTTATQDRDTEKANNLQALQTAKEGNVAVTEAIMILKSFYKEAAKATAFVQGKKYSPVDEDTTGAGFKGNYGGKQDSMKGILGILEVIKSDFDRTMRKTTEAEKEAAASFVEFERVMKADIASKETKLALDREDHETTVATIETKHAELQQNMDLVDEAVRTIESLKPLCIDSGMSYAERVAKREEEITALKTALCILDEEQVESQCQTR